MDGLHYMLSCHSCMSRERLEAGFIYIVIEDILFDFALTCPFFPFGTLTAFTFAPFIHVY
jgi:hypothetical protein